MKTRLIDERIPYTGRELRSHWVMERFGIDGDCMVAFIGSCSVTGEDLVDREDFMLGNVVESDLMLHFICEIFGMGISGIVFAQRLLCEDVAGVINSAVGRPVIVRRGDDLWYGEGKLSVSVATVSPVSGLIHLGLNITTGGVPVKAACLAELGLEPRAVAEGVLEVFLREVDGSLAASKKVKPVL
jgi:hypothetical protein